jgi:hypothetical protein
MRERQVAKTCKEYLTRAAYGLLMGTLAACAACSPTMPPQTVPVQTDPTYGPFGTVLQAYVDLTQPFRRQAAQQAERVPGGAAADAGAEDALRAREQALADALRTALRPNAKQGDLISSSTAEAIRRAIGTLFDSPQRELLLDELGEQNTTPANATAPAVNEKLDAPRVPPRLLEVLPPLPQQLEWDFSGRTLVLRDVDAGLVGDYIPDALPVDPPAGVLVAPATPLPPGARSPLPMPTIGGATLFAVVGDSGSGDDSQYAVAQAMLTYFNTARRFPFVLMLGDNLYHDDYTNEFSVPYKPLLDRGVKFYAALGNHDRDLQIHFKPFNMNDRKYYSFDEGNARFAALNSNDPSEPEQIKWLDGVFANAGTKWRIAFFHHPLYSSGRHAGESRDVIRPALEPVLVRNGLNVVFSGHEHMYERIRPQQGVRYFVSGGGGRYLYTYRASEFDEVGISEHHFMIVEIAGDRMFFEAIAHSQKLLDCGVLYRTPEAAAKPADETTVKWLAECDAGRPRITAAASGPSSPPRTRD